MSDTYANYAALAANETENIDYRITTQDSTSNTLIATIHGGGIEPGTTELTNAIAGAEYDKYLFEGLKSSGNSVLHITSTHFDEPRCMALNAVEGKSIFIHGYSGSEPIVYMGGLDEDLKSRIANALTAAGFNAQVAPYDINASEPENITNKNVIDKGVQLELTLGLRQSMFGNFSGAANRAATQNSTFYAFVNAIRSVLSSLSLGGTSTPAESIARVSKWTNDKLVSKVAELSTNTKLISKDSNGKYTGKAAIEVLKIIDYLNAANEKIAKKIGLVATQTVTLDEAGCFDVMTLDNEFLEVGFISASGYELAWDWINDSQIKVYNKGEGDSVDISYKYLPEQITLTNGEVPGNYAFPRGRVTPELPAYFATYEYLKTNDPTNADQWLVLWNVGFNELRYNRGEELTVVITDKPRRTRIGGR